MVDGSGEIVSEGTVISEPSAIAKYLKTKAGGARRIGLETGPATTWLWHELRALGFLRDVEAQGWMPRKHRSCVIVMA